MTRTNLVTSDGTGLPSSVVSGASLSGTDRMVPSWNAGAAAWTPKRPRPPVTITEIGGTNPAGLKIRGAVFEIKTTQVLYADYWTTGYDAAFIATQFSQAAQIGANCIKNIGDPQNVILGGFSQATYLARIKSFLDTALARGFLVYMELTGNDAYSGTRPSLSQEVTQAVALATLLNQYPNVIGLDLTNEINGLQNTLRGGGTDAQPDATSITWVQTLAAAVKAVTDLPITFSRFVSTDFGTTGVGVNDWNTLIAANCDFIDLHPYYVSSGGSTMMQPTALQTVRNAFPGTPIFLGECDALNQLAESANNVAVLNQMPPLVELPYVAGCCWFSLNDWAIGNGGVANGLFDTNGNERVGITYPFRKLPRRSLYQTSSRPLVIPSGEVALTTSLTQIPHAKFLLQNSAFDSGQNRDPQYRVTVEVGEGLNSGDQIQVAIVDLDTAVVYGTTTVTALTTSAPDTSGNAYNGTANSGVAAVAGQTSIGTYGYSFNGSGVITLPNIPLTTAFTLEAWIKKAAATALDTFIVGRWTNTAANDNYIIGQKSSGNAFYGGAFDGVGTGKFVNGLGNTANNTIWNHVALVWDGATLYLFINGVQQATTAMASLRAMVAGTAPTIGQQSDGAGSFTGNVQQVRLSKVARYTAGFTPPTGPFTVDANTVALYAGAALAATTNQVVRASSPWTFVGPAPVNAGVQVANLTGARGLALSAALETRYA